MKYFTREGYDAWYSWGEEIALRAASDAYRRHLEAMRGVLPGEVLELAQLPGVDDGLIVRVEHDRERQVLTLVVRCGDLQMGYYDLCLTYEGAELTPEDDQTLARIARTTLDDRRHESDLWCHELDTAGENIEHRLRFHPGLWFAVRCRALRWSRVEQPDRSLPPLPDRYPGGPPTP